MINTTIHWFLLSGNIFSPTSVPVPIRKHQFFHILILFYFEVFQSGWSQHSSTPKPTWPPSLHHWWFFKKGEVQAVSPPLIQKEHPAMLTGFQFYVKKKWNSVSIRMFDAELQLQISTYHTSWWWQQQNVEVVRPEQQTLAQSWPLDETSNQMLYLSSHMVSVFKTQARPNLALVGSTGSQTTPWFLLETQPGFGRNPVEERSQMFPH